MMSEALIGVIYVCLDCIMFFCMMYLAHHLESL